MAKCLFCFSASRLGVAVPSIVLIKRNDPLQSRVVYEGEYMEEAIVQFVKHASLPLYVSSLTNLCMKSFK